MNPCAQQVRLFNEVVPQLTQEIGAEHAIPVAEKLNWQLEGCQTHQSTLEFPGGVAPCGNKGERGVPQGADCSHCPFASEVDTFLEDSIG